MQISDVKIKSNVKEVTTAVNDAILRALEICGQKAESFAKENITAQKAVDTGALRGSMNHVVDSAEKVVYIGTDKEYGIYNEFGTGIHYSGGRRTSWVYQDAKGDWHKTNGMKPRPFLKPALENHQQDYEDVFKGELGSL